MDNQILRDGNSGSQQPCYSASGGFEIGNSGGPDTYGNLITGLRAVATADDTIAIFNGVLNDGSGGTNDPAFPQYPVHTKINSTSIVDDGHRAINLNSVMNSANGTNSCGQKLRTHGAQVDVDSTTITNLNSSGHCDPCTEQCPVSFTDKDDSGSAVPKADQRRARLYSMGFSRRK